MKPGTYTMAPSLRLLSTSSTPSVYSRLYSHLHLQSLIICRDGYVIEDLKMKRTDPAHIDSMYENHAVCYIDKYGTLYRDYFLGRGKFCLGRPWRHALPSFYTQSPVTFFKENVFNYIGVSSKSDYILVSYTSTSDPDSLRGILSACGITLDSPLESLQCAIIRRRNVRLHSFSV